MITHKCPLEIVTATFQFSISITPKPFPFSLFNLPPFFSLSISISFPKLCEPNNFLISISMAPTPSSSAKPNQFGFTPKSNQTHIRTATPQSKHRLNFTSAKPSPNPNSNPNPNPNSVPADHPVEVVGRIRDYPDRKDKPVSALQVNPDGRSVRVRTDIGYRDFTLDGVASSEDQDLDEFYTNFVQSRINGVKMGDKCTVMMYGPTGSGKSYTMFGSAKQQGIVYKSLRDILRNGDEEEEEEVGERKAGFVQVTVLEIYNEEIYDLLSTNSGNGGFSIGWSKANASKVKLEVMGKKAKNATFISGTEAGKISKEIQKVEKRRIIKSTSCNERSSRSHCMIILDVPTVGGRLMLVDMAGSENIEQAGQTGFEAKMQTAKINQGNTALKRVVESIANGDSHVPFRDSKLTMLLQDSFEDDKSKILMILCASPDPKEMHKTISTLEYGAKAKCIVRGPHTPIKGDDSSSSDVMLGSRIAAMDQFISKLQMENKIREKEKNEAHKQLQKKEEEIASLRAKLAEAEGKKSEEEINVKVNDMLKRELEKKIEECQKMADRVVEMERKKMEQKIIQQQEELETLRRRLEEIESELTRSREGKQNENESRNLSSSFSLEGNGFAKKLIDMYADEDPGMEKSMDLDKSLDMEISSKREYQKAANNSIQAILGYPYIENDEDVYVPGSTGKSYLSTVFEEDEEEVEEVQKDVIEEKMVCVTNPPPVSAFKFDIDSLSTAAGSESECVDPDTASSRQLRIQNIFTLCGNYRELSQQHTPLTATNKSSENCSDSKETKQKTMNQVVCDSKENCSPLRNSNDVVEVADLSGGNKLPFSSLENKVALTSMEKKLPLTSLENKLPFTSLENKLSAVSFE
ncbi:putative plus-end-directed kinesin ATPase [Helianthus annuus]|nr:putative plus-end-directed kinesin ATPase [Helianthus annuus]